MVSGQSSAFVTTASPPSSWAARPHLLVVDDDDRLRELLRRLLAEAGYVVLTAPDAATARQILADFSLDLLVLDIMMPGESGLQLASSLRQSNPNALPILLLTAKGEAEDRIAGLRAGADDYLPKPFEPEELLLRVQAILRRAASQPKAPQPLQLGSWSYEPERMLLRRGSEEVHLTDMEGKLMRVLAARVGQTVPREELAELSRAPIGDRTIDVQVARLRRKIEVDAKNPRYLLTVRGEGYMLLPDPSER